MSHTFWAGALIAIWEVVVCMVSFSGLTRIRPNNCGFKDAFFGSNPFEFDSGALKIGVTAGILPGVGRQNNPKLPFSLEKSRSTSILFPRS